MVQEELSPWFFCAGCYLLFFSILDTARFLSGAWFCSHRSAWIQCDGSKPFGGARALRGRVRGNCQQLAGLNMDRYYSCHLTVPDFQLYNGRATAGIPAAQLLSYFKISLSTIAWVHSAPQQMRTRVRLSCCAHSCFLPCSACPHGLGFAIPQLLAGFLADRLCFVCLSTLPRAALDHPGATKIPWDRNEEGSDPRWWPALVGFAPFINSLIHKEQLLRLASSGAKPTLRVFLCCWCHGFKGISAQFRNHSCHCTLSNASGSELTKCLWNFHFFLVFF